MSYVVVPGVASVPPTMISNDAVVLGTGKSVKLTNRYNTLFHLYIYKIKRLYRGGGGAKYTTLSQHPDADQQQWRIGGIWPSPTRKKTQPWR